MQALFTPDESLLLRIASTEPEYARWAGRVAAAVTGRRLRESKDATGHEHKGKGEGGGQFTGTGGGGAGSEKKKPRLVFHSTTKIDAKDLATSGIKDESLNQRDSGFFGAGFYTSTDPQDFYGKSIVALKIKPDAKVLDVGPLRPDEPQPWHQEFIDSHVKRIKERRPDIAQEKLDAEIAALTPGNLKFSHIEYAQEVGRFARAEGYDVVSFAEGSETVILNKGAVESITHVGGLKGAEKHKKKHDEDVYMTESRESLEYPPLAKEVKESRDATGHEHKGKGKGGGQFTGTGGGEGNKLDAAKNEMKAIINAKYDNPKQRADDIENARERIEIADALQHSGTEFSYEELIASGYNLQNAEKVYGHAIEGKLTRIMGEPMKLAETQEIDGVIFDRFETENGGAMRMIDKDSGSVIALKKFPSLESAQAGYAKETVNARKMSGEVNESRDSAGHEHRGPGEGGGQFTSGGGTAEKPTPAQAAHAQNQAQQRKHTTVPELDRFPSSHADLHQKAGEIADHLAAKAESLLAKFAGPAKWLRAKTDEFRGKLTERYGAKTSYAIFAAGQIITWGITIGAPAITGLPIMVPPGGGLATTLALAGFVEAYRKISGMMGKELAESLETGEMSAHDVMLHAVELVNELIAGAYTALEKGA